MSIKQSKRDSNIELLRIISMFLIICFHYAYKNNYQYTVLNMNTILVKSVWFWGELGVNIFMLITGYYLSKSKFSIKKFILVILEVLFYNMILCFIGEGVGYNIFEKKLLLFCPIILNQYWFITVYLLIYILSPTYNILINNLDKRNYQKMILVTLLLWCIIPTIFGVFFNSSENMLYYNRFIWLTIIYFIGAYIRKFDIKCLKTKRISGITCLITYLIMVLTIIIIYAQGKVFDRIVFLEIAYFWTPNNILMLILSISLFEFFIELKVKNNIVINKFATTTLAIYMLHDNFISNYIWKNIFYSHIHIYSNNFIIHMIMSAVIIFVVGAIIDWIRQIIEKYTVKKILDLPIWTKMYNKIKIESIIVIDKYI